MQVATARRLLLVHLAPPDSAPPDRSLLHGGSVHANAGGGHDTHICKAEGARAFICQGYTIGGLRRIAISNAFAESWLPAAVCSVADTPTMVASKCQDHGLARAARHLLLTRDGWNRAHGKLARGGRGAKAWGSAMLASRPLGWVYAVSNLGPNIMWILRQCEVRSVMCHACDEDILMYTDSSQT